MSTGKQSGFISDEVYISFGVLQGFVLGPILFSDSEALESLTDLKSRVTDVFTWMTNSKLKLKSKTEFIIISSKKPREKFKDIYSLYYYLTMTHFLKHSLEI